MHPIRLTAGLGVLTFMLLSTAAPGGAEGYDSLVGRTVYNRSIYRLVPAQGRSFPIDALTPLKLARVENQAGSDVLWFEVEGTGLARISDGDLERIARDRKDGHLPADWSWVYTDDPHATHPDWDLRFWEAIAKRTIVYEMTPDMVRMAFGEPERINTNPRPENVQVQWIYSTGSIWFVEGKVFTWQAP